jgi:hypothetical protein
LHHLPLEYKRSFCKALVGGDVRTHHWVLNYSKSKPTKSVRLVIGYPPSPMPCHLQMFWVQDNVHLSASDAQEHAELDKR